MHEKTAIVSSAMSDSTKGLLLGVVLDLSASMCSSVQNNHSGQLSRIENLSQEFRHVMEEANLLINNMATDEAIQLRMFINGFGFLSEGPPTWTSPIGDIFSILSNIDEKVNHYKQLQP